MQNFCAGFSPSYPPLPSPWHGDKKPLSMPLSLRLFRLFESKRMHGIESSPLRLQPKCYGYVGTLIERTNQVTDFGLSRFKATSVSEKMTGQAGTYHWMAPEVINSQHYTEKADVFSYGIILWEIFTRAIPYGGMQPVQVNVWRASVERICGSAPQVRQPLSKVRLGCVRSEELPSARIRAVAR